MTVEVNTPLPDPLVIQQFAIENVRLQSTYPLKRGAYPYLCERLPDGRFPSLGV